ncbi:MAG TPA: hypothetical protein VGE29_18580, partial [Prosthecobacter sp.]
MQQPTFHFSSDGIFYRIAEEHYQQACAQTGTVQREIAPGTFSTFNGFPTEEGLGHAMAALVSWTTAIEASVNFLYEDHVKDFVPAGMVRKLALRNLNTVSRLKEVLINKSSNPRTPLWWDDLRDLFHIKNELVHFETTGRARHRGDVFAQLSPGILSNARQCAETVLRELGELYEARMD